MSIRKITLEIIGIASVSNTQVSSLHRTQPVRDPFWIDEPGRHGDEFV